ncbi:MAG TPA: hypothetical protein PLY86_20490 [bacterium]|nr:hypothetical protein [bacterium]
MKHVRLLENLVRDPPRASTPKQVLRHWNGALGRIGGVIAIDFFLMPFILV